MRTTIRKWGNSVSIRLPAALMKAMRWHIEQELELREDDGRLVIEPARGVEYRLDDLVRDISDQNRHDQVDTGNAVGREAW